MLKDYPIKFNDETIPEPVKWSEDYGVVESVNKTEAGTDQISVTRYDKLSVSCSFQCTSMWAGKFKKYSKSDLVHVLMYDLEANGYRERDMRIREFKAEPVINSRLTLGTNGLWKVSFNLEEF